MVFAYNINGQMIPMKFFSINSACEAFIAMGPGIISIIDDDNDMHRNLDATRGVFVYDDEYEAFLNYNPFNNSGIQHNYCRRYGNNPTVIIGKAKTEEQSLEDIIAQQIEEIKSQRDTTIR